MHYKCNEALFFFIREGLAFLTCPYFISCPLVSFLPVVWSDVRCCVQRHYLPHHHLRPHGNESRPRRQVQCPSDCHSHRRHHQPSGHPHSRRDLWHGGCLAHRTGWDFTTAILITACASLLVNLSLFWMSFFSSSLTHTAWIFDLSHSRNAGENFACQLAITEISLRDVLINESLWGYVGKEGKGESMCYHLVNKT